MYLTVLYVQLFISTSFILKAWKKNRKTNEIQWKCHFVSDTVLPHLEFSESTPEDWSATWVMGFLRTKMQCFLVWSKRWHQLKVHFIVIQSKLPYFKLHFSLYPLRILKSGCHIYWICQLSLFRLSLTLGCRSLSVHLFWLSGQ